MTDRPQMTSSHGLTEETFARLAAEMPVPPPVHTVLRRGHAIRRRRKVAAVVGAAACLAGLGTGLSEIQGTSSHVLVAPPASPEGTKAPALELGLTAATPPGYYQQEIFPAAHPGKSQVEVSPQIVFYKAGESAAERESDAVAVFAQRGPGMQQYIAQVSSMPGYASGQSISVNGDPGWMGYILPTGFLELVWQTDADTDAVLTVGTLDVPDPAAKALAMQIARTVHVSP